MKRLIYILLVLVVFTQTSCFKDPEIVYEGPTVVEFNAAIVANAPQSFPTINVNNGAGDIFARVNLVGAQKTSDQTILYRVDPVRTTAVEGVHYALIGKDGSNGSFVMPANRSIADCGVTILQAPRNAGASVVLVLELIGSADGSVKPSENYKRLTYRILL